MRACALSQDSRARGVRSCARGARWHARAYYARRAGAASPMQAGPARNAVDDDNNTQCAKRKNIRQLKRWLGGPANRGSSSKISALASWRRRACTAQRLLERAGQLGQNKTTTTANQRVSQAEGGGGGRHQTHERAKAKVRAQKSAPPPPPPPPPQPLRPPSQPRARISPLLIRKPNTLILNHAPRETITEGTWELLWSIRAKIQFACESHNIKAAYCTNTKRSNFHGRPSLNA